MVLVSDFTAKALPIARGGRRTGAGAMTNAARTETRSNLQALTLFA